MINTILEIFMKEKRKKVAFIWNVFCGRHCDNLLLCHPGGEAVNSAQGQQRMCLEGKLHALTLRGPRMCVRSQRNWLLALRGM